MYRGYYRDTETGWYYLNTRYYDPSVCRFINADDIGYINPESLNGLNLYVYCGNNPVMGYDPDGHFDWATFWKGVGWVVMAIAAIAVSIATFGAGVPVIIGIIAGVTLGAGILTGINGIATMVEAGTEYNFVRDGLFNEVLGLSDGAYDVYAGVTAGVAAVGTAVLGVYQTTGQFRAAQQGRQFLGKGYKKVGDRRWVSKDGMRQLRWDVHKNKSVTNHFNMQKFRNNYWINNRSPFSGKNIHQYYKGFKTWIE